MFCAARYEPGRFFWQKNSASFQQAKRGRYIIDFSQDLQLFVFWKKKYDKN